ncbi:hypothetical protein [uncultured Winogradskyella sp.]|uniref:hypothetical protein n=1 Tax=uncultured Winogradskyella sp. TaxID=395353 RepID=UPI002626FCF9|nr:hypothetical protein [uncultured Winogradskyella sp.]
MQKRKIYSILYSFIILMITSCVKDVDFDQADDFSLTPVLAASVVYTNVEASRFSENGMELETVSDTIANIEIFTDDFVIDNLVKAELIFEATNSINRTFGLQVDFLNEIDEIQHSFLFDASPSPLGDEVLTEYIEVFEDVTLEALKMTRKMIITLRLYPSNDGSSLDEDSAGEIGLKSRGTFYLNLSL